MGHRAVEVGPSSYVYIVFISKYLKISPSNINHIQIQQQR